MSLQDLLEEILHTLSLVQAYPFLAAQATDFETFVTDWSALFAQELAHRRALLDAEARIIVVDDALDRLSGIITNNLLANNDNDRKSAEYQRYYGEARPSDLRRPVLGAQLKAMRAWPPSLATSTSLALRDNGLALADLIAQADQAVHAHSEAERELADFQLRTCKPFVDRLNANRLLLHGQLAELPHTHPERGLPRAFAHRFFLRTSGGRKWTIADAERSVLRMRRTLQQREDLLARLIEERDREQRMRDDAELAAAAQALAEAERAQAEAQAHLDELRTRLLDDGPEEPASAEPAAPDAPAPDA